MSDWPVWHNIGPVLRAAWKVEDAGTHAGHRMYMTSLRSYAVIPKEFDGTMTEAEKSAVRKQVDCLMGSFIRLTPEQMKDAGFKRKVREAFHGIYPDAQIVRA